jgi:hypothetical protein
MSPQRGRGNTMDRMSRISRPSLPKGWRDLVLQIVILAVAIFAYELTRGLADGAAAVSAATSNAADVIHAERTLGLFFEPSVQQWTLSVPHLDTILSWIYLNVQTTVTLGGMLWIYLWHNPRYYFVRNMFFVTFLLACVIYTLVPTAPPRLMPGFGFVDTVEQADGARKFIWTAFANPYAAMPSMHVAFSLMIGWSIASLVEKKWVRALWLAYPGAILFVVVATGNHFWLDAAAGAVIAGFGAIAANALARVRPTAWAWNAQPSRATT